MINQPTLLYVFNCICRCAESTHRPCGPHHLHLHHLRSSRTCCFCMHDRLHSMVFRTRDNPLFSTLSASSCMHSLTVHACESLLQRALVLVGVLVVARQGSMLGRSITRCICAVSPRARMAPPCVHEWSDRKHSVHVRCWGGPGRTVV